MVGSNASILHSSTVSSHVQFLRQLSGDVEQFAQGAAQVSNSLQNVRSQLEKVAANDATVDALKVQISNWLEARRTMTTSLNALADLRHLPSAGDTVSDKLQALELEITHKESEEAQRKAEYDQAAYLESVPVLNDVERLARPSVNLAYHHWQAAVRDRRHVEDQLADLSDGWLSLLHNVLGQVSFASVQSPAQVVDHSGQPNFLLLSASTVGVAGSALRVVGGPNPGSLQGSNAQPQGGVSLGIQGTPGPAPSTAVQGRALSAEFSRTDADLKSSFQTYYNDPSTDKYGFYYNPKGNCTSYVAWRLNELAKSEGSSWTFSDNNVNGVKSINGHIVQMGNAADWGKQASELGYPTTTYPTVGSVAWWGSGAGLGADGHVAIVKAVNPDGSFVVEESSWGQYVFKTETITIGPHSKMPYPTGFLHLLPGT